MRILLCAFLCFCLFVLLGSSSHLNAQSYNPFPGTDTYSFIFSNPGDTILHSIRVDSIYTSGADVVYEFNRINRKDTVGALLGDCSGNVTLPNPTIFNSPTRYRSRPNGFGNYMLQRPNGVYDFVDVPREDTFHLETQIPVGTSWLVNQQSGLTATLDSITLMSFFNVTDSVMHISLCNGNQIQLSSQYGFIRAVPWVPLLFPDIPSSLYPPQYDLRGIDAAGIGSARPGFEEIFDFQPGDKYQTKSEDIDYENGGTTSYAEHIVQSWGPVPQGMGGVHNVESISYVARTWQPADTIYAAPAPINVVINSSSFFYAVDGSMEWEMLGCNSPDVCGGPMIEIAKIKRGKVVYSYRYYDCNGIQCTSAYGPFWEMTEGLGRTYYYLFDILSIYGGHESIETICYETSRGSSADTCEALDTGPVVSVPDPAMDLLSLVEVGQDIFAGKLHLFIPKGEQYISLYSLDGRSVWEMERRGGEDEIEVDVSGFSKGVYILEIVDPEYLPLRKKIILY